MDSKGVNEAMRLEYFCQVLAELIFKNVKEFLDAHDSWETFEEALLAAYGYERTKGPRPSQFYQWVAS